MSFAQDSGLTVLGKTLAAGSGMGKIFDWGLAVSATALAVRLGQIAQLTRSEKLFRSSLLSQSMRVLAANRPFVPRSPIGLIADRPVVVEAPQRCGKTVALSHELFGTHYPWWSRMFFPPRGFFLTGDVGHESARYWAKNQIATEKNDPFAAVNDLVKDRFDEQRIRRFLVTHFPVPSFLAPQPSHIIIDQAEELLQAHREEFLAAMQPLLKVCRDTPNALQVTLITSTPAGTASFRALNGGAMCREVSCPLPATDDVRSILGSETASVYEKFSRRIGHAIGFAVKVDLKLWSSTWPADKTVSNPTNSGTL
jgi:hypothetical protein